MTAHTLQDAAAAPAALTAFLRGVERRGVVFAQLLVGSPDAGDAALATTLRVFHDSAGRAAFADWPRRFWAQLLAAPALRQPPPRPAWPPEFDWLAALGHGPRAALLLRLVAGLPEADAAAVLGIAPQTYRLALERAAPRDGHGEVDEAAWRALGEAAQDMVRSLPPGRLALLARAREDAIDPERARRRAGDADRGPRRSRWRIAALCAVALATLLALAATFRATRLAPDAVTGIHREALPAAAPAARLDPDAALATHRDLELLLDAGAAGPAAADPAFHAWHAAQLDQVEGAGAVDAMPSGDGPQAAEDTPVAAGDVAPQALPASLRDAADALPLERRAQFLALQARLAALSPDEHARLRQRIVEWDALPHAERRERREDRAAWQALPGDERARMDAAAAAFAALAPEDRQALRARFDALDESERRGWRLGPELGADYPKLHALLAQVPPQERAPLLAALRAMGPDGRADLAVLAQRTPPQARDELRIALLATPADERPAWLRRQVEP